MRVLTADEMRAVDRRAIEELGIPSLVLMENAAVGVADALGEYFPSAEIVTVACGPGNNGGDGLALARHLDARAYRVRTFLVTGSRGLAGDGAEQLRILERSGKEVARLGPDDDPSTLIEAVAGSDLWVDALFGTGLSRPLEGPWARLVSALGALPVPMLAVDLPSGLSGSSSEVPGPHARAELTVTFAAPKVAHVLPPACEAMGELVVTDLGIPPELVPEAPGSLHLSTEAEMAASLLRRPAASHKGSFGHALVVGGSPGKSGAVVLAARAAVRSGAGLVTAAVPPSLLPWVDAGSVESMTFPIPGLEPGADGGAGPAREAVAAVLALAEGKEALALGPGLGLGPEAVNVVRALAAELHLPLVLDADGLNAVAGELEGLAGRSAPTILTPHPGEAARLLGTETAEVQADRRSAARRLARRSGAVVVLKGHRTLIAVPETAEPEIGDPGIGSPGEGAEEGELWINPTGNSGMASGGSGDVLTGVIVGLLAQGYDAAHAARLGAYAHGLAGDLAAERQGRSALAASDVVDQLGSAWLRLGDGR